MEEKKTVTNLENEIPKATSKTWNILEEVLRREYGVFKSRTDLFATHCYSSSYIAKRMKLSYHLNHPSGSVEVINFNNRGGLICVGSSYNEGKSSDVGLIDWAGNKMKATLDEKVAAKISDIHFLNANNYEDQLNIVSVYGNGFMRFDCLTPTGLQALRNYRLSVEPHRLAICPGTQHEILSASLSGKIFNIDLRCAQQETYSPTLLTETVAGGQNIHLQAISHHPLAPQICASYDDYNVRTFDKRRFDRPLHEICPERLKSLKNPARISDCFYNFDGSEILAIYTDTEIFLFDSENKQPGEFKQTFHQMGFLAGFTNKTCFFGPKSEYVIVGDDGQRIAFIDKVTGEYVGHTALWPHGRWCSVYFNDLKSHPHLPIVAAAAGHFSILGPTSDKETTYRQRTKKRESSAMNTKVSHARPFFQAGKRCNMQ